MAYGTGGELVEEPDTAPSYVRTALAGIAAIAVALAVYEAAQGRANIHEPTGFMAAAAALICGGLYFMAPRVKAATFSIGIVSSITFLAWSYFGWNVLIGRFDVGIAAFILPIMLALVLVGRRAVMGFSIASFVAVALAASAGWLQGTAQEPTVILGLLMPFFIILFAQILAGDRKKLRDALADVEREKEEVHAILRANSDAVLIQRTNKLEAANPAAAIFLNNLGLAHNPSRWEFMQALGPKTGELVEAAFQRTTAGMPTQITVSAGDDQGSDEHLSHEVSIYRTGHEGGHVVACIRDVRERVQAIQAQERAREDSRIRTLNLVTHQMSTPLMPILLESKLLLRRLEGADESVVDALKMIERNAQRAVEMVHLMIEASRTHDGGAEAWRQLNKGISDVPVSQHQSGAPRTATSRPVSGPNGSKPE